MQVRETTNLSISSSVKAGLPHILAYQWGEDTPIELPKTIWKELEKLLFAYCEQEIGKTITKRKVFELYHLNIKAPSIVLVLFLYLWSHMKKYNSNRQMYIHS